jgi:hypothetical protein
LSQYPYPPPPYSPPIVDPSAWSHAAPHAEARAAAMWQLIFGTLIFLFGTCVSILLVVPEEIVNEIVHQPQLNLPPIEHLSLVQEFRLAVAVGSGMTLAAGSLLLILAIFVRKGGKASTVISIILTCLIGLFILFGVPNELLQVAANPIAIFSLLISLSILALCITTIVKLSIAFKSTGSAQSVAQQQAYYWMMQQQAGTYNHAGYNYQGGYPPPPNPPLPPQGDPPQLPSPDQPPMPSDREK